MLTSTDIEMIVVDYMNGVTPPRVTGKEADEFRKRLETDIALAERNGWELELPFEI